MIAARGRVVGIRGTLVFARLPAARVGDGVRMIGRGDVIAGQVTSVDREHAAIAAHGAVDGIAQQSVVCVDGRALRVPLGTVLLGRAVDARGNACDGGRSPCGCATLVAPSAPAPALRAPVDTPLWCGIPAIDGLLTIGRGARVGVFGPPGTGKTTLLKSLAFAASADATVVGLIGERGREAQTWIEARAPHMCVVCATSDRPAVERVRAAQVAMAQACALRARGLHVLLVLDSLARFGAALREVALANGEVPGLGGYPASVFAALASLVEAAGALRTGSITLLATVLTDADDRDPIGDAARSLLDGHIALSPKLAARGRFPALDVPASVSRTMADVVASSHERDAAIVREALATLART